MQLDTPQQKHLLLSLLEQTNVPFPMAQMAAELRNAIEAASITPDAQEQTQTPGDS